MIDRTGIARLDGGCGSGVKDLDDPPMTFARERGWNLSDYIGYLTLLSCLMPYLKFGPFGNDLQPHFIALFFGLYLWTRRPSILEDRRVANAFLIAIFYGGVLFALGSSLPALSFVLIPLLTVLVLHEPVYVMDRAAKTATVLYLTGCVVQLIQGGGVLDSIVSNARGSDSRGLHSFASEPSYLALVSLAIATYFLWRRSSVVWLLAIVIVALSSGSLTGIVPLAIVLVLHSFHTRSTARVVTVSVAVVTAFVMTYLLVDASSRVGKLIFGLEADAAYLFSDVSFANRVVRSIGPLYLAAERGFMPQRLVGDDASYRLDWTFVTSDADLVVERTTNLLSVVAFDLGILALPLIVVLGLAVRAPAYLVFCAVYLCATNISSLTPYVAIVFALLLVHNRRRRKLDPVAPVGSDNNPFGDRNLSI